MGDIPDFVHKQGPTVGRLDQTRLGDLRAGKCAFLMSEQLAGDQGIGHGAAIKSDERPPGPGAESMHHAGDQFLASARFARNQHRAVSAGHLVHHGLDHSNTPAFTDQDRRRGLGVMLGDLLNRGFHLALGKGIGHFPAQLIRIERFGQIVECTLFGGFHGAVNGRESGNEDEIDLRKAAANFPHKLQPAQLRHFYIADDQIAGGAQQMIFGIMRIAESRNLVALLFQNPTNLFEGNRFVIHDHYFFGHPYQPRLLSMSIFRGLKFPTNAEIGRNGTF